MTTIGWYGPLIDLSKAGSHIGEFVQLLVLIHKSTPVQYKLLKGGEVIRTDIQVGDDTRQFFSVSIWKKQMGEMLVAGNVILLENVKVIRFGEVVEARTVQQSSLQCLVHPYESVFLKDNLIEGCRVGTATKEKLRKVVEWVQRSGPAPHKFELHSYQNKNRQPINWKVHAETQHRDCFSLSEVLDLTDSCKATFFASNGEIFLPITWKRLHEFEEERMFIRRRLCIIGDRNLAEDMICSGCQLCNAPLYSELGSGIEQKSVPLHCQNSTNRLHVESWIYRPFMLYVWDNSKYIPLLVTNKAAELLFGNIKAGSVYSCYRKQVCGQMPNTTIMHKEKKPCVRATDQPNGTGGKYTFSSPAEDKSLEKMRKDQFGQNLNFYSIWLILLKTLLQPGKNSPLKFKVKVDVNKDWDNGRYEMVSVSLPAL